VLCVAIAAVTACRGGTAGDGPAARDARVVLVVVDALRADHLGAYGYRLHDTSPNIDRRAERGLLFERSWAASSWTLPSFGSILTGLLPSAHAAGVEVSDDTEAAFETAAARNFVTLPESVPTVAGILSAAGFATGAFVANPFLDPRFGLGRGFGYYDHDDASNVEARPAAEVVDRALAWIDERGERPFFLMVHLMDAHLNYDAPAPFGGRFTGEVDTDLQLPVKGLWPTRNRVDEMSDSERAFITAAYDEEIAYIDAEVDRLLAGLEQRGVLDSGLVVLTADHGEELFDHGGFEHGHSMYDEVLRVPLILWGRGVSPGREAMPVSLIDVAPTVLDAAGVSYPGTSDDAGGKGGLPGISLLDDARPDWPARRAIIAERLLYGPETKAIVEWPDKAIVEIDSGRAQLFDLQIDPGEQDDLAAGDPELLARLLTEMSDRLAEAEAAGAAPGTDLDEDLLRRLRALGYIR
jgi:arylsulfatase A-like enzyme